MGQCMKIGVKEVIGLIAGSFAVSVLVSILLPASFGIILPIDLGLEWTLVIIIVVAVVIFYYLLKYTKLYLEGKEDKERLKK